MSPTSRLRNNFSILFWIQSLTEVKVLNVISTLFYLHRGLTLPQIFLTGLVYAAISLVSEIPSSYLADRWGRKNLIICATFLNLLYWIFIVFAHGFPAFVLAFILFGLANAFMSGTDEALIYDTSRALGEDDQSLQSLGGYFSGQRIFKIFVPLVAVLIAHDLTEIQYLLILLIDVVANILALCLCFRLTEPTHVLEVEQIEAGVFRDAIKLLKQNPALYRASFSRALPWLAIFIIWRLHSDYFVSIGVPLIFLGLATSLYQGTIFLINRNSHKLISYLLLPERLNFLNIVYTAIMGLFFVFSIFSLNKFLILFFFAALNVTEVIRWPLFSEYFNKISQSYNRATTLSLANLVTNFLNIPVLVLGAYLSSLGFQYIFALAFSLCLFSILFLRLPSTHPPVDSIADSPK